MKRALDLQQGLTTERIHHLGAIDGDRGAVVLDLIYDLMILRSVAHLTGIAKLRWKQIFVRSKNKTQPAMISMLRFI